ncbi:MAG: SIS domain-containing protein [Dehalococcoidales bacterium]|nr:SIS domain-containing protein [Dehalococcoidales bacterium]
MSVDYELIKEYVTEVIESLSVISTGTITRIITVIRAARDSGKSIFVFGNGGSAATATHMASDLAKGAMSPGKSRIKAFSLTDNLSLVTAWANDSAYENVFSEQLEGFINKGDVAIGISGSGNSQNVLNGVIKARVKGAVTIGLIGFDGGKLKDLVDIPLVVNNYDMRQVEDIHILIEHIITLCLQEGE